MLPDNWLKKTLRRPTSVPRYLWTWVLSSQGRSLQIRRFNRWYHRGFGRYENNPDGINLLAKDWDQCLILDACRYDMFADQYVGHLPEGALSRVSSAVSNTAELVRTVFTGQHTDTVYVTANPMLARYRDESDVTFHKEIHVWEDAGWDSTYRTVLPETMVEYTREAADRFPSKRLLVHFLQPHHPFLTERTRFDKTLPDTDAAEEPNIWDRLLWGDLNLEPGDIWPHYRANLDAILPVVANLLSELPGKTVVTSDHGNHLGERVYPIPVREWGHPRGIYTPELVEVPWFVSENGPRKSISKDDPIEIASHEQETIDERLTALGYRG